MMVLLLQSTSMRMSTMSTMMMQRALLIVRQWIRELTRTRTRTNQENVAKSNGGIGTSFQRRKQRRLLVLQLLKLFLQLCATKKKNKQKKNQQDSLTSLRSSYVVELFVELLGACMRTRRRR
jgi:hypothetical protein